MGASSRRKGVEGEQAVARAFREAGFRVESLQRNEAGNCDLIVGDRFYIDTKRAETWKMHQWLEQVQAQTPAGSVPVLAMRRSRGEWWVTLRLADFADVAR